MMPGDIVISVVLPAHNEVDLLESCVRDLIKAMRDRDEAFEIVIVENGSTDATLPLARRIEAETQEVHVFHLHKPDYGAAVAKGFAEARGRFVVHFDVDYVDLGFLERAVGLIADGSAGIVLASKRAPGATDRRPLIRRLLTAGFTLVMRHLLSLSVSDAHGMKVLSREQCAAAAGAATMTGGLYDVEVVLRASRAGVKVVELPADVTEIRPPRTPVFGRAIESAIGLAHLRWILWKETHLHPNA